MSEIDKHLERAEKHLQKGKGDAALGEYLEALQEDPAHEVAAQAAADLYLSMGHEREATDLLRGIFDRQAALGRGGPAAATYRKLIKVTTPSPERSLLAARLLEKTSRREAVDAYEAAMHGFMAGGHTAEALGALEGLVGLEPSVENLRQLGELAEKTGNAPRASAAFLQAGNLIAADDTYAPEAFQLCQRAHTLNPGSAAAAAGYARVLLMSGRPGSANQAADMLQRFATGPQATPETRAAYARALLATGRTRDAEPFLWQLFHEDPGQIDYVLLLIGHLLDNERAAEAVELARRVEQHQQQAGRQLEYAAMMSKVVNEHTPCTEFLEYLVALFNATNREPEYCQALLQLFELHYAAGNFLKAVECLESAVEVDSYAPGYRKRLEMLRGKIDATRLRNISGRLMGVVSAEEKAPGTASGAEPTVLEDLMLQAEIYLQYSLRSKAAERLQRIRKLFPDEELTNEKLRDLCASAGIALPAMPGTLPETVAGSATTAGAGSPAAVVSGAGAGEAAVDDLTRVTEITRNIHRQSNVKSVLFTAVNEAGRHWNASRCIAVLCTPGKPPATALEYCAPGLQQSDVHAIVKLMGLLQPLVIAHGPLALAESGTAPWLAPLKQFAAGIGIDSLLAMPLIEGEEHIGLMLLAQCGADRNWGPTDNVVLKNIADQTVLALSNARLRSLVKNLAVTEEKSGLLKRSSYLDMLLSEVRRAMQQNSTVTVMLLNFGKPSELVRQAGKPAVEAMLQQVGQLVSSHIRQGDVAVRYDLTTVALILGDTDEKNAFQAVDKLRTVLANLRLGNTTTSNVTFGIAEAVMQPRYDPVDVVTEVINRVEAALHLALAEGGNRARALTPTTYASATA